MALGEGLEGRAADEGQLRIADRGHRGRARQAVDGRKLADDAARPDDGENPLGARRRDHADLEQALLDPVAAVARIACDKKHLVRGELPRLGIGEKLRRQALGKHRKKVGGVAHSRRQLRDQPVRRR